MYEEKINAYFDAPERRAELVEAISWYAFAACGRSPCQACPAPPPPPPPWRRV